MAWCRYTCLLLSHLALPACRLMSAPSIKAEYVKELDIDIPERPLASYTPGAYHGMNYAIVRGGVLISIGSERRV
ncbi:hypothetical protein B0H34DRAFT_732483 [Crassisporium funariophilum]|nr:hypothetical protein B0H34DRAFT_732483 [Crassisporium funariophilum]